jgi:hypothetical protein
MIDYPIVAHKSSLFQQPRHTERPSSFGVVAKTLAAPPWRRQAATDAAEGGPESLCVQSSTFGKTKHCFKVVPLFLFEIEQDITDENVNKRVCACAANRCLRVRALLLRLA